MSDARPPADKNVPRLTRAEVDVVVAAVAQTRLSGAPLSAALAAAADSAGGETRRALRELATRVERGESLSAGLAAVAPTLPPYVAELLRLTERDERGGALLAEYVRGQRDERLLRREVAASLGYPLCVFALALGVAVFLARLTGRAMFEMYRELEIAMPESVAVHAWLGDWGPIFLGASLASLVVVLGLLRFGLGADRFGSVFHGVPLVGAVWGNLAIARWARALRLMIEGGATLPTALRTVAVGSGSSRLGDATRGVAERVEQGSTLADALAEYDTWSEGIVAFVRHGEEHRSLPEALESVALSCEQRARLRGRWSRAAFPAFVFVFIAHVALFSYVNLIRPIVDLISKLA